MLQCFLHLFCIFKSFMDIRLHRLSHNVLQLVAVAVIQVFQLDQILSFCIRVDSGHQKIKYCSQTVQIAPPVQMDPIPIFSCQNHLRFFCLFRRSKLAAEPDQFFIALTVNRNIKVDQTDISIFLYHNVCRFDVTVQDWRFSRMKIIQNFQKLLHPEQKLFFRKMHLPVTVVLQIMPRNIIHDRINPAIYLDKIINLRQIPMMQIFQDINFNTAVHDVHTVILYLFDDHLFLKIFMIRQINLSNTSLTKMPYDRIGRGKSEICHCSFTCMFLFIRFSFFLLLSTYRM